MDTVSREKRSEIMGKVRCRDTSPEMAVRKLVYALGYRYRLHRSDLPGKPDLVFVGKRKIIFVHGCFWHRHEGCKLARIPKSRVDFWASKLDKNKERDIKHTQTLQADGWTVLTIWECETKNIVALKERLVAFLSGNESK